jgi:hypothetical protein
MRSELVVALIVHAFDGPFDGPVHPVAPGFAEAGRGRSSKDGSVW